MLFLLLQSGLETPTLSGGQQPGSMEALKQMLFRLQNEESSIVSPTAGVSIIPQVSWGPSLCRSLSFSLSHPLSLSLIYLVKSSIRANYISCFICSSKSYL